MKLVWGLELQLPLSRQEVGSHRAPNSPVVNDGLKNETFRQIF